MIAVALTVIIFRIVWMITILLGTAYIVFWLGYSGWWWLLALVLLAGASGETKVTGKTGKSP